MILRYCKAFRRKLETLHQPVSSFISFYTAGSTQTEGIRLDPDGARHSECDICFRTLVVRRGRPWALNGCPRIRQSSRFQVSNIVATHVFFYLCCGDITVVLSTSCYPVAGLSTFENFRMALLVVALLCFDCKALYIKKDLCRLYVVIIMAVVAVSIMKLLCRRLGVPCVY